MKHALQESIDIAVMERLTEAHEELTALCGLIDQTQPDTATARARLESLTWSLGDVIRSLRKPTRQERCIHPRPVCVGTAARGIQVFQCNECGLRYELDSSD